MLKHNWKMDCGTLRMACENDLGDKTYVYQQSCDREGCKAHQEISIVTIKDIGRFSFLEREWVS
jgi:hypothetical protein